MNVRSGAAAALVAAAALLSGCGEHSEIRTGPLRTEQREVGAFDSIRVRGATRLEITVGAPRSLEIEGRDPFLQRLETDVRGDTLHIRTGRKDWVTIGTSPRLTVRIGVPQLASLEVEGGNDVRLEGFDGGETRIRVEGAANIVGSGRLDELTVSLAGAGNADLGTLVARRAEVTVSGVGNVFVHPLESLDATMNGVGSIHYAGNPRDVNTRMNGFGTIGQRRAPAEREQRPPDPQTLQPEYERDQIEMTETI